MLLVKGARVLPCGLSLQGHIQFRATHVSSDVIAGSHVCMASVSALTSMQGHPNGCEFTSGHANSRFLGNGLNTTGLYLPFVKVLNKKGNPHECPLTRACVFAN